MQVDENRQHGGRPPYPSQQPRRTDLIIPNPKLKLLDQVREVMRLKHYSIRTERSYCDWIRRYIHFHRMKLREELLAEPESKMELFLSDLAVKRSRRRLHPEPGLQCPAVPLHANPSAPAPGCAGSARRPTGAGAGGSDT